MKKKIIKYVALVILVFCQNNLFAQKKAQDEYVEEKLEHILESLNSREKEIGGYFLVSLKRTTVKKYIGKPLEIYDNPDFKDKPVFTLTPDSFFEGGKETSFQELLNKVQTKELKTSQNQEESDTVLTHKFVYFSKIYASLFGKVYSDKHFQLEDSGKKYYLKITDEIKSYLEKDKDKDFLYKNVFVEKKQQAEIDRIVNEALDFKAFIDELKKCVKAKDEECLFKYQAIIENSFNRHIQETHYKNVFLIRQILDDPSLCEKWYETRSRDFEGDVHIPKSFEKKVNKSLSSAWDSIEKALSFDLAYSYVTLQTDKLKDKITEATISKKSLKRSDCGYGNHDTTYFYFSKESNGWKIIGFALTPYDFAD